MSDDAHHINIHGVCVVVGSVEEAVVVEVKMETGTMEQEITLELHGKSNTGHVAVVI